MLPIPPIHECSDDPLCLAVRLRSTGFGEVLGDVVLRAKRNKRMIGSAFPFSPTVGIPVMDGEGYALLLLIAGIRSRVGKQPPSHE